MFTSFLVIILLQGKRRECLDEPPEEEDIFGPEHYGEVGYARDVCVELGRNLIRALQLTVATPRCQKLANEKVLSRALKMVEDFNNRVSGYPVITEIARQKFIWNSVDIAVDRLIKSKAVGANSNLIGEIHKLRSKYCLTYKPPSVGEEFQTKDEEEDELKRVTNTDHGEQIDNGNIEGKESTKLIREAETEILWDANDNIHSAFISGLPEEYTADDLEEFQQKEFLQTKTDSWRKAGGNLEDYGKIQTGKDMFREIEIESLTTPNENTAEENEEMEELTLHKSIFQNNYSRVNAILRDGYDLMRKDKHGNTALHLAVMLGRRVFVEALVNNGALVKSKNLLGWSPVDEAVSYGDPEIVKLLMRVLPAQAQDEIIKKRRILLEELKTVPDFYMELQWEFLSIVSPFSFFLPSDLCKIRKRDRSIRMDWTLLGMNNRMTYDYGHDALLFDGTATPIPLVYYMKVNQKNFVKIDIEDNTEISESEAEARARRKMKADITVYTTSTRNVAYTPVQNWWRKGTCKTETIGQFEAAIYSISGLVLKRRVRSEHNLIRKELKKKAEQKAKSMTRKAGDIHDNKKENYDRNEDYGGVRKRLKEEISLPPPPATDVTWGEYIEAEPGKYQTLAREPVVKENVYEVKESNLAMVPTFPISKDTFAKILEVLAPFKQFNKLREFMEMKLPPGFPLKLGHYNSL